jgi:hypothetical protein
VNDVSDRELSVREAAEIIYRTEQPTPQQIVQVSRRLACGALKGRKSSSGQWTSTAACVAQYMAGQTYLRLLGEAGRPAAVRPPAAGRTPVARAHHKQYGAVRAVYEEVLRDYFLALIFRRRQGRSRTFYGAVVAGQAGMLLVILLLLAVAMRAMGRSLLDTLPAEQATVHRWLAEHERDFRVGRWHPPAPDPAGGSRVRVEYSYTAPNGKTIQTDRIFVVKDDRVVDCSSGP